MREHRAREQIQALKSEAEVAKREAEEARAVVAILQQELSNALRDFEEATIDAMRNRLALDDAAEQIEQLQSSQSGPSTSRLKLKLRNGAYRPEFQLMCSKVLFLRAPQNTASEIVRTVMEFCYDTDLTDLVLPVRSTLRRLVDAGGIFAEAVGADIVADSDEAICQHIDATSKHGKVAHGSTLTTPEQKTVSLGWQQSPKKNTEYQFAVNLQMIDDMEESGEEVFGLERGNTLQKIGVMMADKGSCENKQHKCLQQHKENFERENGASTKEAKRRAHVVRAECSKHILGNVSQETQREGLSKMTVA